MPKNNLIFKLDNLEYQYNYLKGTLDEFEPRLNGTKKFYNSIGKNNAKRVAKLLKELKMDKVENDLNNLRIKIFNNKVYNCEKNLKSTLLKQLKQEESRPQSKSKRTTTDNKKDLKKIIRVTKEKYGFEEFVNYLIKSKLIKLSVNKIIPNKGYLTHPHAQWFLEHEYWKISEDKTNEHNPSYIWNEVVIKTKGLDQLVSNLMNNTKVKEILATFSDGMDVFLSINKGKKQSINGQTKEVSKNSQDKQTQNNTRNADAEKTRSISESNSDDEDEFVSFADNDMDDLENDNNDDVDFDKMDTILQQYKNAVGASDEEDDDEVDGFGLNPLVDYSQVTDEEPSEDDNEDFEKNPRKRQKMELPELMTGFYSGDSDSEFEEDQIAREQKKNDAPKKNRRGQRARRKIWEKKYGSEAKHVIRDLEKQREERVQRQIEYEARVAKRELKAQEAAASGSNLVAVGDRKVGQKEISNAPKEEHPSWVAKKLQEEKHKKATFSGKKITFD